MVALSRAGLRAAEEALRTDIGTIQFELKQLLGMEVDVLTPNSLPASFRDQGLREAATA